MGSRVLLSIIMVNWNVRDLARKGILSIRRESLLPADEYEIIVVDNASADGSAEMFRALLYRFEYFCEQNDLADPAST